jgi:hypothetical protein
MSSVTDGCGGFVSIPLGAPAFLVWRETVGKNDGRAVLALPRT